MRLIPSTLIALGAVAGLSGAAAAYQAATSDEPVVTRNVSDSPDPTPSTVVNLLPCDDGSELRDDVCVRIEDRFVPAAPATSSDDTSSPTAEPTPEADDDDAFDDDDVFDDDAFEDDDADEAEDADDGDHGDDDGADHDVDDDHGGDSDDDDDADDSSDDD